MHAFGGPVGLVVDVFVGTISNKQHKPTQDSWSMQHIFSTQSNASSFGLGLGLGPIIQITMSGGLLDPPFLPPLHGITLFSIAHHIHKLSMACLIHTNIYIGFWVIICMGEEWATELPLVSCVAWALIMVFTLDLICTANTSRS